MPAYNEVDGIPVHGMDELDSYLKSHHVDVAVLTVPKAAALPVTNTLIDNGVDAIWNFTNVEVTAPDSDTMVENMHFSDSLLTLSYYVSERQDEKNAKAARAERLL